MARTVAGSAQSSLIEFGLLGLGEKYAREPTLQLRQRRPFRTISVQSDFAASARQRCAYAPASPAPDLTSMLV